MVRQLHGEAVVHSVYSIVPLLHFIMYQVVYQIVPVSELNAYIGGALQKQHTICTH